MRKMILILTNFTKFFLLIVISVFLQATSFPIIVEGSGESTTSARANALALISEQISVSVNSQLDISKTVDNDNYQKRIKQNIKTNSAISLQAVDFENLKSSNGKYLIRATFSYTSYDKTIQWLKSKLDVDIKKIDNKTKKDLLKVISDLKALVVYGGTVDIDLDGLKSKENTILKYLNMARLQVITSPKDATLKVNNILKQGNKIIFLNEKKVFINVSKDGFVEESKKIFLNKGKLTTIKIELVKTSKNLQSFKISSNSQEIKDQAESAITDFGYLISNNDDAILIKIKIKKSMRKIDDEIFRAKVLMKLTAYKNNNQLKGVKGGFKINGYKDDIDSKIETKVLKIIKKAIKKLLLKLNN